MTDRNYDSSRPVDADAYWLLRSKCEDLERQLTAERERSRRLDVEVEGLMHALSVKPAQEVAFERVYAAIVPLIVESNWAACLGYCLATGGALCEAHEVGDRCGTERATIIEDAYYKGVQRTEFALDAVWRPGCGREFP